MFPPTGFIIKGAMVIPELSATSFVYSKILQQSPPIRNGHKTPGAKWQLIRNFADLQKCNTLVKNSAIIVFNQ